MLVKVGLHRGHADVCFCTQADAFEVQRRLGLGNVGRITMALSEVSLTLSATAFGGSTIVRSEERQVGTDWTEYVRCELRPRVRCHRFVTTAEFFGQQLVVDMLLPYLLPWAKEVKHLTHAELLVELRQRMASAEKHTGHRRIALPPGIMQALTEAEQVRLFTEWAI